MRSEYQVIRDRLMTLRRQEDAALVADRPVPKELEKEMIELNKDLEFLRAEERQRQFRGFAHRIGAVMVDPWG